MAKKTLPHLQSLFLRHQLICLIVETGVRLFCISYYLLSGDGNKLIGQLRIFDGKQAPPRILVKTYGDIKTLALVASDTFFRGFRLPIPKDSGLVLSLNYK